LRKQRLERIVQNFQPRHFGITQIDNDPGAIGGLDSGLAQGIAQPNRPRFTDGMAFGILRL